MNLSDDEFKTAWADGKTLMQISALWGGRDPSMVSRRAKSLMLPSRRNGGERPEGPIREKTDQEIVLHFVRLLQGKDSVTVDSIIKAVRAMIDVS